jgi:tRNA C32,U32 (ribose-2'-O)-methylase TrmJ
MKTLYTLSNNEWSITIKIGRAPLNNSAGPIEADFYYIASDGKETLQSCKFYPNFAEALKEAIIVTGMTY